MKKSIFSLLLALFSFGTKAQNDTYLDSAKAGQMCIVMYRHTVIQPNAHLKISTQWSFNQNFVPMFDSVRVDTVNTLGVVDTIYGVDTISFSIIYPYWVRYRQINVVTGGIKNSVELKITPLPIPYAPTISFPQAPFPFAGGAQQSYAYDAGNDTATVTFFVGPGDSTTMSSGNTFNMPSFSVTGINQMTYNFTGYPDGYWIAYYAKIQNSIGTSFTDTMFVKTYVSTGNPWISILNSWTTTPDSAYVHFNYISYNTNSGIWIYISNSQTGAPIDSVYQWVLGTPFGTIIDLSASFGGLNQNSPYWVWASATPGNTSPRMQVYTQPAPTVLTAAITNAQTVGSVTEQFEVQITSAVAGSFNLMISPDTNDVGFTNIAVYATGTQSFGQGFSSNILNISTLNGGQGFVPNAWYLAKSFAFNSNGESVNSLPVTFQFLPQFAGWSEATPKELKNIWYYDYVIRGTDVEEGILKVTDVTGREVWSGKVFGDVEIPFQASPGVYLIHLGQNYKKILVR